MVKLLLSDLEDYFSEAFEGAHVEAWISRSGNIKAEAKKLIDAGIDPKVVNAWANAYPHVSVYVAASANTSKEEMEELMYDYLKAMGWPQSRAYKLSECIDKNEFNEALGWKQSYFPYNSAPAECYEFTGIEEKYIDVE